MKLLVFTISSAICLCAFVADGDAATTKKRYKRPHLGPVYAPRVHGYRPYRRSSEYYERLPDSVPFGSKRWWTIQEERNMPSGR
jgi:hypothetical protein